MRAFRKSWILLAPAVLLAVEPLRVRAQVVPTPLIVPATAPATQPAIPVGGPPVTDIRIPARTTGPATTQNIKVHFENASVDAVLEHLSRVAGFIIVKDTSAPIEGRVTIISPTGLTPAEAITLLNTVLKNSGYVALQQERILKIIKAADAKKEAIPVYFGADPSKIPVTDDMITQVIPIKTVDATKLKLDLTAMFNTEADVSANSASNVLVITDRQSRIRRIVEIIANLDKRDPADNGIRVKQLKYADAAATAKLIEDIFKPEDQQGGSNVPPQVRFFQALQGGGRGGGGGGGGGAQDPSDKSRAGKIVASSDQRTNTVVVTGPEDTLKVIDKLLTDLDANPLSEQTFFIYSLKNAQAANLQNVLNNLFGSGGSSSGGRSGTTGTGTGTGTGSNRMQATAAGSNSGIGGGGGSGRGGGGGFSGGGGGGFSGGGGGGIGGNTSSGSGGNRNSSANTGIGGGGLGRGGNTGQGGSSTAGGLADLMGQVYVVADQDTNSLLVATATKYQDHVKEVIAQLDRPVAQVLIKVLIAEVTHDNTEDLGADFSILNKSSAGNGTSFGQNLGTASTTGGLVVNLVERDINVTLRALATAGKLDVLSRPYILASDNQQANMTVGSYVPFVQNTRIDSLGGQTNTIQYQDIGIILNVTPHINPDGLVILDVSPEISSLTTSSVTISNGVTAPIYSVRSADSRVGIMNGQTIVIGGLMQDQKQTTIQKIPILGDIPLLGRLFQRDQVSKTKTELLIFLTPHVAQRPDVLKPMSQDELKGTKLTPGAVESGIFDDHMRGMQRGATTVVPQDAAPEWKPPTTSATTKPSAP